ncbi:MAG: hypothetical protein Q9218_005455 [Villophora microphyllina]
MAEMAPIIRSEYDSLVSNPDDIKKRLQTSGTAALLSQDLENVIRKCKGLVIDRFICTAIGSFSAGTVETPNKPLCQLAAFQIMKEVIDKAFLASYGYKVTEVGASALVTETTFFFAINAPWNHLRTMISTVFPALYVGDDMRGLRDGFEPLETKPATEREMLSGVCDQINFWRRVIHEDFGPFLVVKESSEELFIMEDEYRDGNKVIVYFSERPVWEGPRVIPTRAIMRRLEIATKEELSLL